jgi:hypothetical protein
MGYKLANNQQDLTPLQREYLIQSYPKLIELQTFGVKSFNKAFGQMDNNKKPEGSHDPAKQQLKQMIKERRQRG